MTKTKLTREQKKKRRSEKVKTAEKNRAVRLVTAVHHEKTGHLTEKDRARIARSDRKIRKERRKRIVRTSILALLAGVIVASGVLSSMTGLF